jgi:hypothetical protein
VDAVSVCWVKVTGVSALAQPDLMSVSVRDALSKHVCTAVGAPEWVATVVMTAPADSMVGTPMMNAHLRLRDGRGGMAAGPVTRYPLPYAATFPVAELRGARPRPVLYLARNV